MALSGLIKRNCATGFHLALGVVAQLLPRETMAKTILSPFTYC